MGFHVAVPAGHVLISDLAWLYTTQRGTYVCQAGSAGRLMSDRTPIFDDVVATIGLDWAELQGGGDEIPSAPEAVAEEAVS